MIPKWDDPNAVLGVFTDQAYSLSLLAEFEAATTAWAETLASKSLVTLRLGKDAAFRQKGVKAFFEECEPVWKGR